MKAKITLVIAIFIFAFIVSSKAQLTAYANIYAEVIAPIGIEKATDLTINQTIVGGETVSATAASFTVKGSSLTTFDVTFPSEALTVSNGQSIMTVGNFTNTATPGNAVQSNNNMIRIAATLNVNGSQSAGNYKAQDPFQVTLNYN